MVYAGKYMKLENWEKSEVDIVAGSWGWYVEYVKLMRNRHWGNC